MKNFKFIRCKTLDETLHFLAENRGKCKVIAGGTDLTIALREQAREVENVKYIVDISSLEEILGVEKSEREVKIGSATTFSEIMNSQVLNSQFSLLTEAASQIGSPQIRNLGTIGGNICNLAACADSVAPLLVLKAKAEVRSHEEKFIKPLCEILPSGDTNKIRLSQEQILTKIILPFADYNSDNTVFYKLGRRKGVSLSRLSFAIYMKTDQNKNIEDFRFGAGAVYRSPRRLFDIEEKYSGKQLTTELCKQISTDIGRNVLKNTGVRWSTEYKLPVLQQIVFKLMMSFGHERS